MSDNVKSATRAPRCRRPAFAIVLVRIPLGVFEALETFSSRAFETGTQSLNEESQSMPVTRWTSMPNAETWWKVCFGVAKYVRRPFSSN
jgi:hypothetical protein